jgi:hypothetical protein
MLPQRRLSLVSVAAETFFSALPPSRWGYYPLTWMSYGFSRLLYNSKQVSETLERI